MPKANVLCSGIVERIGLEDAKFKYKTKAHSITFTSAIANHNAALELVSQQLLDAETGSITSVNAIAIVGHRVVHGGKYFKGATLITEAVISKIKSLFSLAPLHNPANLEGITVAASIFPNAQQIAVFDTAFHQSIPEHAYKYAIPNSYMEKDDIRLYGFHGTSHKYVSATAIKHLNKAESKLISIHLGNGCSMTAIQNGKSIDHSLGFSPLNGLIMGTRCGDIDPSIIFHMAKQHGYSFDEINTILHKKSGMLGLTGHSDLRDILENAEHGDRNCQLALSMSAYRIKKYIGSYAAVLNGLDAIVFTAGIGENAPKIRDMVCERLDYLGIAINPSKNNTTLGTGVLDISAAHSKVKVLVIATDEELEIATQAAQLIGN